MGFTINSKREFELVFKNFILPLVGLNENEVSYSEILNEESELVILKNQELLFYEAKDSNYCYIVKVSKNYPKYSLKLLRTVYSKLLDLRHKNYNETIKNKYDSLNHLIKNYEYAVQNAVLDWFTGSSINLFDLIIVLEQWQQKTYEGKKVPFAFLIDPNSIRGEFNYIEFLREEYSATFSDGITSIIELDKNLCFLGFRSITDKNITLANELKNSPFRFAQVIETFTKQKLAVFLLVNGDIVLVKDCEILLVKREGKWLNFNKEVFKSIICAELKRFDKSFYDYLDEIYLSSLDVSFSHAGGIISCVECGKVNQLFESNTQNPIVDLLDNLLPNNDMIDEKNYNSPEQKKRLLKRQFLLKVVDNKKFNDIDRSLRSQMISMDGATILDFNGDVISVGAIIRNDSGSYGGGRGAAARKLSNYGFAVKISTDGYIELYINDRIKYKIK